MFPIMGAPAFASHPQMGAVRLAKMWGEEAPLLRGIHFLPLKRFSLLRLD
jgi:hypothetical protein